ncbi:hypothetical protein PaecuDRAFT_0955 [Paenibacillus curdlanolyticus YK9]|uniref:Uncharacterized protein n=1 Tax=Paenibacillus curdlanolyticus YK9 TaxID=717606 RepID=E0I5N3_9BACL|nr:hypothetical protein [Paenibacillus curdlanolyticus]EFM12275.1 hypothetical protein PaecuDRAFT_0955 [Paenibacillus curdlanolyticus YK9]
MTMTQKEMLFIVQSQLAIDLNCTVDDLNRDKDSMISLPFIRGLTLHFLPDTERIKPMAQIFYI